MTCSNKCCKKHRCCCERKFIICPPIPPVQIRKAIALVESQNLTLDQYLIDSVYFTWYQDETMPKFPIIETDGTVFNNILLLDKYYNEGYRYFLGFSRSTILSGVISWFLSHPDAIGISLTAGATSLAIPKNVYRLISPLTTVMPTLDKVTAGATNVYYIYDNAEVISQSLKILLENDPLIQSKLKLYPIMNNSSYNVPDLTNFLMGSTSNDVIFLGITEPDLYSDLYNNGLMFTGNQYTVVGLGLNVSTFIEPCASILDQKYYLIDNIYTNTSLLYRENYDYLQNKYGPNGVNGNIQNAMKMIQYFLLNKNIDYLGSYNGTLEFDANKDLKYSSYIIEQYLKSLSGFKNYYISFDDPLLGKFEAYFV